jgi:hypothetical protein
LPGGIFSSVFVEVVYPSLNSSLYRKEKEQGEMSETELNLDGLELEGQS